jgi:acetyltransferase-like isoleucine patch superfamily enzyme
MIHRDPLPAGLKTRVRAAAQQHGGALVRWGWNHAKQLAAIGPMSPEAQRFGSFGDGSVICFPNDGLVNVESIHLGANTLISSHVVLSAGWGPGHVGLPDRVVSIGDRCLIGRGSSVIGHRLIKIGDDVWTGQHVHLTDMNHGYERLDIPISQQNQPENPIRIGQGSWLGHHVVVLPGVTIGEHVVVGAGSVVNRDLPSFSVCAGSPAKVIRKYDGIGEWKRISPEAATQNLSALL